MEILHTPRLCIDGRSAQELGPRGLIAQEVIDQLVSGAGTETASSEWIERKRTVLLTHPTQVFSGQLKRFDTKRKIGRSPFYWMWEKHFAKTANITAFHRFRPIDRLNPSLKIPTITTVLPAKSHLPFFVSRRSNQQYIVPSQIDAKILEKSFQIQRDQIHIFRPGARRYIHFVEPVRRAAEGYILFLIGDKKEAKNLKKLRHVFSQVFPHVPHKLVKLKKQTNMAPLHWMKLLQNTKVSVYLTSQSFDWATLALESLFWGIPTVFPDNHHALSELLPQSPLRLSQFLVDQPDQGTLLSHAREARQALESQGAYSALNMAEQYTALYRDLNMPSAPDLPETGCCN